MGLNKYRHEYPAWIVTVLLIVMACAARYRYIAIRRRPQNRRKITADGERSKHGR